MADRVTPQDALVNKPEAERKLMIPLNAYAAFEQSTTPEMEDIKAGLYHYLADLNRAITAYSKEQKTSK